jgi:hypothetical protein
VGRVRLIWRLSRKAAAFAGKRRSSWWLSGIGFLAIITAAVVAALIEAVRGRVRGSAERELASRLDEIGARLRTIEAGFAGVGSGLKGASESKSD